MVEGAGIQDKRATADAPPPGPAFTPFIPTAANLSPLARASPPAGLLQTQDRRAALARVKLLQLEAAYLSGRGDSVNRVTLRVSGNLVNLATTNRGRGG
jgi:hypothetical protein